MKFFSLGNIAYFSIYIAIVIACWAMSQKIKTRNWAGLGAVIVSAFFLMVNATVIDFMLLYHTPAKWILALNNIACSVFIPYLYFYLCKTLGLKDIYWNIVLMSSFSLLLFLPNIIISLDGTDPRAVTELPATLINSRFISVVKGGEMLVEMPLYLLVVLLHIIVCAVPVLAEFEKARVLRLTMNKSLRISLLIWGSFFLLLAACAPLPMSFVTTPLGRWIAFLAYTLPMCAVFIFYGLGYDEARFVENETQEMVNLTDTFSEFSHLAQAAHLLFKDDNFVFQQGLLVDEAVARLGTNRTYFTRMMKAEFGCNFNEYIAKVRADKAKILLKETNKPLDEIATLCGFGDASSLNRTFKKEVGETPDRWRRAQRNA